MSGMRENQPDENRAYEASRTVSRPDKTAVEPGVGELVTRATQQISELVRAELRLAVTELKNKGRHAGIGAGLFGSAGLIAAYGGAALVAAVIAAFALLLPVWAAALLVGVVLLAVAGVLGLTGRKQITQAIPPVPEEAVGSTRADINEIKERAHR